MKTISVKEAEIKKTWFLMDASGQTLGRFASEVARILRGKHKPSFTPHLDCGDCVVVINADKIRLTGQKWKNKLYHHHTGWVGGIKAASAQDLLRTHPERLLSSAINGMLPKTKLGRRMKKHVRVYAGAEHPHESQRLESAPLRLSKSSS